MAQRNVCGLAVTGGGAAAISWLFATPGASSSMLFAEVPYSRAALTAFLRRELRSTQSCSPEAAHEIAVEALRRTASLLLAEERSWKSLTSNQVFGVSCTAALVSIPSKRGPHRCFVGAADSSGTKIYSLELQKGLRDRVAEDIQCSHIVLRAIAQAGSGLASNADFVEAVARTAGGTLLLTAEETLREELRPEDPLEAILARRYDTCFFLERTRPAETPYAFWRDFSALADVDLPRGTYVYSGSFNPLHEGHTRLVAAALARGRKAGEETPLVVFELSAFNADKPPLTAVELQRRVVQFRASNAAVAAAQLDNIAVCVTNEPFFVDKARLFPHARFVIGADTMLRVLNPKYYGSVENMVAALAAIRGCGCRFLVGGRKGDEGFVTAQYLLQRVAASGLQLPSDIADMFEAISEEDFRVDLSSTEIRARGILPTPS